MDVINNYNEYVIWLIHQWAYFEDYLPTVLILIEIERRALPEIPRRVDSWDIECILQQQFMHVIGFLAYHSNSFMMAKQAFVCKKILEKRAISTFVWG